MVTCQQIVHRLKRFFVKLSRIVTLLMLTSTTAFGFMLSDQTKRAWIAPPTEVPPLQQGYWDFRQFKNCEVPLTLLTKRLPSSTADSKDEKPIPISADDLRKEVQAVVDGWNKVTPSILKIALKVDEGARWEGNPNDVADPIENDGANVLLFGRRGSLDEPGHTVPHPLRQKGIGVVEEMGDTDVSLHAFTAQSLRWTSDDKEHKINRSGTSVLDIQTIALHELGHFLGLGHDNSNRAFTMYPTVPLQADRDLDKDDENGLNFLYTPDLGDAPDPTASSGLQSQTKVHTSRQRKTTDGKSMTLNGISINEPGRGAVHLLGFPPFEFEWLGDKIDGECEAKQTDLDIDSDDGVTIRPTWVIQQNLRRLANLTIRVKISLTSDQKILAERYDVDYLKRDPNEEPKDDRAIYLNAWADWRKVDNYWTPDEKIIGTGSPTGTQKLVPNRGGGGVLSTIVKTYSIEAPKSEIAGLYEITEDDVKHGVWLRFRLDYAEDAGAKRRPWSSPDLNGPEGMAAFGEVEDWPIPLTDRAGEPVQPVSFSFKIPVGSGGTCKGKTPELGSIQISELWATLTNCQNGQPLPEGTQATFTVSLKAGVETLQSVSDIDSITASAPGFEPTVVRNFTVQTVSVPLPPPAPPVSIKIIDLGRVCLKPK